jgi:hypothetical protein
MRLLSPDYMNSRPFVSSRPAPPYPSVDEISTYRLHLPSYNGVLEASIGIPTGASLEGDNSWNVSGVSPVVYVGTSITQVVCAHLCMCVCMYVCACVCVRAMSSGR